ncbi:MAG: hypothetical protein AAF483_11425 [Planctomycetota bacterium]
MDKKRKAEEKRQRRIDRRNADTPTSKLEEIDARDREVSEETRQDQDSVG